jgi:hypothetical protein
LLLYIYDKVESKYHYYPDFEQSVPRFFDEKLKPAKVTIKRLEEHPDFSPDWLKEPEQVEEDDPDRELTADDFEITSECFEETIELDEFEIPPPPPNIEGEATDH